MKLYHATYGPLVPSIKKEGLIAGKPSLWGVKNAKPALFFALEEEVAISFAETCDEAYEKYERNPSLGLELVVFEIEGKNLDPQLLSLDENILGNQGEYLQYEGDIPPEHLSEYRHLYV